VHTTFASTPGQRFGPPHGPFLREGFEHALRACGFNDSTAAGQLFRELDVDGDGAVSLEDFSEAEILSSMICMHRTS